MIIRHIPKILILLVYLCSYPLLLIADEQSHPFASEQAKQVATQYYQKNIQRNATVASTALERIERKVQAKQSFDAQDWYGSRYGFERVLADNNQDFQAWILLCKSYIGLQEYETYQNYDEALQAALISAYQTASNDLDRAAVNWLASQSKLQYGDLRQVALKQAKQADIESHLSTLLKGYPKEFLPYQLDIPSRTDIASACISLTYPLVKTRNFHYEDHISLIPKVKDLSVLARGKQLCFEGLTFGESYKLTLKAGLPGDQNVKLASDQTVNLFVPHRKPAIRFREKGYILASTAPQVLPFVAVNVSDVKVKIIHIPERNIQAVEANWFSNQLSRWDSDNLQEEKGQVIWEGTYHFPVETDKTAVSGLPIDQMLGKKLLPGVYVVEARTKQDSYDENDFASQALVISDIGLSTYNGPDGLHVYARSLSNAKVIPGVTINLIARNNRELSKATTLQNGSATFAAALLNGKGGNRPAFLTASIEGKEFTVLNLKAEAFDLSDRGTAGRNAAGAMDGYVFTERGIYRPGETVHLVSLLRDNKGKVPNPLPLTLKLIRPDGVITSETILQDKGFGSYELDYPINSAAQTGHWTAAIHLDPKGPSLSYATFEVNDFVPPRIEVKTHSTLKSLKPEQNNPIEVEALYYFGPPGANLKVSAESTLTRMNEPFAKWKGYQFGLVEEQWAPQRFKLPDTTTDANGKAQLNSRVSIEPQTTQPLQLETTTTVYEAGGRGQLSKSITPFWHQPYIIGISPRFKDNISGSNVNAEFDVVALNQEGNLQGANSLRYTLFEEHHDYVWFRSGVNWQYEVVIRDNVVTSGTLALDNKAPTHFKVPVKYGSYRLEVLDEKTGVATSVRFAAGWFYSADMPDRPDMLEMAIDESPSTSHKVKVQLKSPFSGELFIAIAGDTFKPVHAGKITEEGLTLELPIRKALGSSSRNYLIATVFRPGDEKNAQLPKRAIGVSWIENKEVIKKHHLALSLEHPETVKGGSDLTIKVKPTKPAQDLRVVAALVDEGTLSLTHFVTPDPFAYFFSQQQLAFELRDSYGLLINPYGARPGSFEVGGGESGLSRALTQLPARTYKVVSLFSGIVEGNGKDAVTIPFKLPEYSGKLRLMVMAWDGEAIGKAQSYVTVKDPLDIYVSLPRFLAANDSITVPVILKNLDAPAGDYSVTLSSAKQTTTQKISLKKGEELRLSMPLTYTDNGIKKVEVSVKGPANFQYQREWEISVRPKVQPIVKQHYGKIDPKDSLTLDNQLLENWVENNTQIHLSVGSLPELGRASLIQDLLQYPYYCLEQTTSRLFAAAFSEKPSLETIEKGYSQLTTLQKIDGSFSLWAQGGPTEPWLTLYAADMLQLMKQKGHAVPISLLQNLNQWIVEASNLAPRNNADVAIVSYAHYLLAKQQQGSLRSLRFFADNQTQPITERHSLAFIAAAFAYYGDDTNAALWFDKAMQAKPTTNTTYYSGFGSELRDQAILVTMLAETSTDKAKLYPQLQVLLDKAKLSQYHSTQEKAWLVRADIALNDARKAYQLKLDQQGYEGTKAALFSFNAEKLKKSSVLHNTGDTPVYYALTQEGEPKEVKSLPQTGFNIKRTVYTLSGTLADLSQIQSGELYIVKLQGQRLNNQLHHVLLVDLLPAGFEIERNMSNLSEQFSWLGDLSHPSRIESRDDRFMAAFELASQNDFNVAYMVRAVTAGSFAYPASFVEAMYQPMYFAYGEEQVLHVHAK
ncbi:MAG: alpha-2-macroglobulin [Candidatus Berkiella sp.]